MGILVRTFNPLTFKMKTIFVIAILFSISKSGEGKQIDIWSLPANPSIPSGKQPGTTQSGKNPPSLMQLICFQIPSNNYARLDHELTFDEAIESMVFKICDADSDNGLSWEEVKACDGKYCTVLPITCPDKNDFDSYDVDKNGILTWEEWKSQIE